MSQTDSGADEMVVAPVNPAAPTWLALAAGLSFVLIAAISTLGMLRSLGLEPLWKEGPSHGGPALAAPPVVAEPSHGCQKATVLHTGGDRKAAVRTEPNLAESARALLGPGVFMTLPDGTDVEVCDLEVNRSKKGNLQHWRRIRGGPADGLWIHQDVLELR